MKSRGWDIAFQKKCMGKNSCNVDEATMRTIEQNAKKLWGIAKLFNLHEGKEIFLYPEGTTKLAVEIK